MSRVLACCARAAQPVCAVPTVPAEIPRSELGPKNCRDIQKHKGGSGRGLEIAAITRSPKVYLGSRWTQIRCIIAFSVPYTKSSYKLLYVFSNHSTVAYSITLNPSTYSSDSYPGTARGFVYLCRQNHIASFSHDDAVGCLQLVDSTEATYCHNDLSLAGFEPESSVPDLIE